MEDQSLGNECNTKDPHMQMTRHMPIDCSKSLLNYDFDELDVFSHPIFSENKITYVLN